MDDTDDILNEIVAECARLEAELLRGKRIVPTALDVERPGMAAVGGKRGDTASDWLGYLRWLDRTSADAERPARAAAGAASSLSDAALDRVLADALVDRPAAFACSDGTTRFAYPKSYDTLRFLDELDVAMRVAAADGQLAALLAVGADAAVAALAPRMESLAVRLWLWIITDPAPMLPFDENAPLPALPDWTRTLGPEDVLTALRAHVEVNATRLKLVASLFAPDPDSGHSSLTLAGFLGSITADAEPGAARRLLQGTPLGQVFAQRVTAAKAARDAHAQAQRDAESRAA